MYQAWGSFVTEVITEELKKRVNVDYFLKIKPEPRLKEEKSLIAKAFYRGKNYKDLYNDITDKVGTRFVVLLARDIDRICNIVEQSEIWTSSKDRDFDKEREENPTTFEYQSVHYIVRNKLDIQFMGIDIKKNTPCEIQIRTLLQHAYSELTHDTIYKPKTFSSPLVHRKVARSMALIETTDEIFSEVNSLFDNDEDVEKVLNILKVEYDKIAIPDYEESLNTFIFDAYKGLLDHQFFKNLETYLDDKIEVIKAIIDIKYEQFLIYRQPIVLLMFFLVEKQKYKAIKLWPLTPEKLRPIFTDLGKAFPKS